ncbi:DNA-binding transcriptional regulator, LysR family [Kaistia soli DSM 19436]|uniref:DNA-binding transcriptional regulator, LysR family n=1 Tax=Kaistia soli DSM 19436 TaxID=1122133 RepID=A0A1M5PSB0_9HYPH|nr:LysR family transcriptional regulator [Kaistia soli]SHH04648.1 DNA-binding transcriptional regulator, LysR family [Kaistia soli DSM 19436]
MPVSNLKDIEWSDLRLFLIVARSGGLGAAARSSGVSAPTLGRRVAVLERQLGMRLFSKSRVGYQPTEAGRRLLCHAEEVETAVAGIVRWRGETAGPRAVRISAGHWMTRFLASHVGSVRQSGDDWTLDFVTANARLDIGRREADIGIRNRRPDEHTLAGRRIATVAFAVYARRGSDAPALPWIGLAADAALTPSAQWLEREADGPIVFRCTDPRTLLDLARVGVGRVVLPCLVGDADPQLERGSALIASLTSEQWLVTHHDDRHDAAVHAAAIRIARLIGSHKRLFAGERPAG